MIDDLPKKRTCYCDYDSSADLILVPDLHSLARIMGINPSTICYKRTRRGWHIAIVFLEEFTEIELIALQAIFESDPMREALNFMRYRESKGRDVPKFWKDRSNILYSKKL
jgi:hypothetical protein